MAQVKLDPQYLPFADQLVRLSRENGVELTDYAEGLLRLAAEAWLEEPRPTPADLLRVQNAEAQARRLTGR